FGLVPGAPPLARVLSPLPWSLSLPLRPRFAAGAGVAALVSPLPPVLGRLPPPFPRCGPLGSLPAASLVPALAALGLGRPLPSSSLLPPLPARGSVPPPGRALVPSWVAFAVPGLLAP
ncbi:hypothetical protein C3R44_23760, partial [Mycobacterium tuberculosis]